ncbi:hypothetical protein [Lacipirellula limnantheis]|uniref:Carboxypeptidase regulatory-like domain-containing protein n=1 Tax=Lacipirellula limnantheis TaxID=2528024 RepID=A0A517U4U3_9BACT|nr:hypothetical protein [Lacipirellula limnantheis]QDT75639.1 hypothetical protein I41_48790 [Lacipirellula limnantheis]
MGAWLMLACGCGEDRGLIPVYGTVTLEGKQMPGAGDLTFVPVEVAAGFPTRPAKAEFAVDGEYSAQSYQPGDGLYPGTYRVLVSCWEVPPTPDGPPAKSFIARRYQNREDSKLEVKVDAAMDRIEFPIDLTP